MKIIRANFLREIFKTKPKRIASFISNNYRLNNPEIFYHNFKEYIYERDDSFYKIEPPMFSIVSNVGIAKYELRFNVSCKAIPLPGPGEKKEDMLLVDIEIGEWELIDLIEVVKNKYSFLKNTVDSSYYGQDRMRSVLLFYFYA